MNFAWENTLQKKSNFKEIIYSYPKNLVHLDNLCWKKLFYIFFRWVGLLHKIRLIQSIRPQSYSTLYLFPKNIVLFAIDAPAKTRWHTAHDSFAREGLPLSEMNPAQIKKTYALDNFLSESGYDQMHQIIDLKKITWLL